jgi:isopentenyldiphosphate isomerase
MQNETTEAIEVVSQDNRPTGEVKTRAQVHEAGDWHRTIHVWIIDTRGRTLLQQRSNLKPQFPGTWDLAVGGHINAGQEPVDSAIRECQEELGLSVTPKELIRLFEVSQEDDIKGWRNPHREIVTVFLTRRDIQVGELRLQKEEVANITLKSVNDFRDDLASNPNKYYPHPEEYRRIIELMLDPTHLHSL